MTESSSAAAPHSLLASMRHPRIIVGVDGSQPALVALRQAAVLATALGGSVLAVTTWQPPMTDGVLANPLGWSPEADARTILGAATKEALGVVAADWLTLTVEQGPAAKVLLSLSHDADLLIVGTRGHSGLAGVLLGSVSAACAEQSACPTLVMHGTEFAAAV